jgi:hypothetical protein
MLSWLWRILFRRKAKPGEIWWADVPYEDGSGHKVRPCLIVKVRLAGYDVLKITSQAQSQRRDHIQIETRSWDRNASKNSYLDLTDPIRIRSVDNRAGILDRPTWTKVKRLHRV